MRVLAKRERAARAATIAAIDAASAALTSARTTAPVPVAAKGEAPAHEWSGTKLRFQNPDGTWGEFVDLRGPKGARGNNGTSGGGAGGAASRFDPSSLADAVDTPTPTEVQVLQNGQWVRATWAQFAAWVGAVAPPAAIDAILTEGSDRLTTEDNNNLTQE